jgi:branched-chain amino acid transport system permease protein
MTEFIQQLLNAASLGGTYALVALGLAIVFSILHLINFAHGELVTIPGYIMLGLYLLHLPWAAYAIGGILSGVVVAVLMERFAFRPVRNTSEATMLLTSFGLSVIIQAVLVMAISARPQAVPQPDWISSSLVIAGLRIQVRQVVTIAVTASALVGLSIILKRSSIGLAVRAAALDFDAARLMGIEANRVIMTAFAISGLLAGIASVLTLALRGSVDPAMGLRPLLMAFVANAIGGIGNLSGAVAGGLLLGFVEVALRVWLPEGVTGFVDGFLFLVVAIILVVKPDGLLGVIRVERV